MEIWRLAKDVQLQVRVILLDNPSFRDKAICMITDVSERRYQEELYRSFIRNISHDGNPGYQLLVRYGRQD